MNFLFECHRSRSAHCLLLFAGLLSSSPALAASCPKYPGNLPYGSARWQRVGEERWELVTNSKQKYSCRNPIQQDELSSLSSEPKLVEYEIDVFKCGPLQLTMSKCVGDLNSTNRVVKELRRNFCNVYGSLYGTARWRYTLTDKNGDEFTLLGLPDARHDMLRHVRVWKPNRVINSCLNPNVKKEVGLWVFMAGAQEISLRRVINYRSTPVKQPSL